MVNIRADRSLLKKKAKLSQEWRNEEKNFPVPILNFPEFRKHYSTLLGSENSPHKLAAFAASSLEDFGKSEPDVILRRA